MLHLKDIMFKSISPLGLKLPVHVCNMDRERENEFTFYLGTEQAITTGTYISVHILTRLDVGNIL